MMWLLLAVLTAVSASAQDIISKRLAGRVSPYLISWGWTVFSLPWLAAACLAEGPSVLQPGFWPVLVLGTALLTVSSTFFFKALASGDLSLTVPILSFTPLFLLVTSPLMLGEVPDAHGTMGVFMIVVGSYVLFSRRGDGWRGPLGRMLHARGSRYMLMTALIFSIGGNVDKIGVQLSSPMVWALYQNAAVAVALGCILALRERGILLQVKTNFRLLSLLGFMFALMMLFQMNALKLTLVPYVIAVKRTSIVLSALWGIHILGESRGWRRIAATVIMAAGVGVIAFSH